MTALDPRTIAAQHMLMARLVEARNAAKQPAERLRHERQIEAFRERMEADAANDTRPPPPGWQDGSNPR